MYNTFVKSIYFLSKIPWVFPLRFKLWFKEQNKIFTNIKKNQHKTIWIHCSSLGEYEFIKSLIPELKKINSKIHLTFFSSSGYDNFNDFNLVESMSYLPFDIKSKMSSFINHINPSLVLISQNDVWPNMIKVLRNKKIPIILIGCKLHPLKVNNWIRQIYYKKYYKLITSIFCLDKFTMNKLNNLNINNTLLINNIRINQIVKDSCQKFDDEKITNFIKNDKVIIYGSTEEDDYPVIINFIKENKDLKHIIIPHEINDFTIKKLMQLFLPSMSLYSKINRKKTNPNILVVDTFGILKHLYKYTNISYVGGGFNKGIHNILEPAIHGNTILFGPKHIQFKEANYFIKHKIAVSIKNSSEFNKFLKLHLNSKQNSKQTKKYRRKVVSNYIIKNQQNPIEIITKIKAVINKSIPDFRMIVLFCIFI
ncbi:MAG: hypothetical protein CBD51_005045 [Flavobacteriales bacterium TMED191]|nr:MAG: hypothetical protein CBD51_005045 [Flavobacteriales bacterium TMED191]